MPRRREPEPAADASYRERLRAEKRESTLQVLFKVARKLDELAVARLAKQSGAPRLRRAHASLLPHIDWSGTRINELSTRLGVTKQAVSQLVTDLEELGVLARVADPEDARARRVVFTERGKRGLLEGLAVLRELEEELAGAIGKRAMAELRAALLALHDRLEAGSTR